MSDRSRRNLVQGALAFAAIALISACETPQRAAQRPGKIPRIGYLGPSTGTRNLEVFRAGLRELGYLEESTIRIEQRLTDSPNHYPALAVELVDLQVDVIVAAGTPPAQAAMHTTRTIPIVFPNVGDPIQAGLVASLAQPGGNVTGSTDLAPDIQGKRLQLLREMVPGISRVMVLTDTAISQATGDLRNAQQAAQSLGLQLMLPEMYVATDIPAAFEMAVLDHAEALLVTGTALMIAERGRIVEFARAARLPLLAQTRAFAADGGLGSYGPNVDALYRRAATYVDKLLKGAKPADLPVERATTFDFVINLTTAQALGLTIPQSVLQQATEVIQ